MTLKHWWNTKPYWLKGGMIGLILILVSYALLAAAIAEFGCTGGSHATKICTDWDIVSYYFTFLVTTPFNSNIFFGFFIAAFSILFVVGSLVGWVVGKIKSKKK